MLIFQFTEQFWEQYFSIKQLKQKISVIYLLAENNKKLVKKLLFEYKYLRFFYDVYEIFISP